MAFTSIVAILAFSIAAEQANAFCVNPLPCGLPLPPISLPATFPCPPVPVKLTQKPDIRIPLPLPAEIPIGNFCSCQKYEIAPTLLPCAPPAPSSLPLAQPAPLSAPGLPLSPDVLKALLGARPLPPACSCGCA